VTGRAKPAPDRTANLGRNAQGGSTGGDAEDDGFEQMTAWSAENELGRPIELRIVPAVQFQDVEGDALKSGPLSLWDLQKGLRRRLVFFVESVAQVAQMIRFDSPSAAELFYSGSIMNAIHGVIVPCDSTTVNRVGKNSASRNSALLARSLWHVGSCCTAWKGLPLARLVQRMARERNRCKSQPCVDKRSIAPTINSVGS
jgi:hypothetical protein